jgi:hypothetical protein
MPQDPETDPYAGTPITEETDPYAGTPIAPSYPWRRAPLDLAIGAVKGAAHTAIDAGSLIQAIPGVSTAVDALYGTPGLSKNAFPAAREATAYSNPVQMAGGAAETLGEMAVPVGAAADALPSAARAGQKFESVMAAAKDVPIDVEAPGQVALRIKQLADRGGSMPMVVRKFLNRITDPDMGAMTYQEGRDFASNVSRLSADEYGRLTPVVGREVTNLRMTLNKAVGVAAAKAGKMEEYQAAMKEYANAARLNEAWNNIWTGVKRAAPYATGSAVGTAAATWGMAKIKALFGE